MKTIFYQTYIFVKYLHYFISYKKVVKTLNKYLNQSCVAMFTRVFLPVQGDNPRALDKRGIIILYHPQQCRPCSAWSSIFVLKFVISGKSCIISTTLARNYKHLKLMD